MGMRVGSSTGTHSTLITVLTHSPYGTSTGTRHEDSIIHLHVNASLLHHGEHQLLLEGLRFLCAGLCAGLRGSLDSHHFELLAPLESTIRLLDLLELQNTCLALSPPSEESFDVLAHASTR